jgi:microcompartment protein CcmL/EutN
LNKPALGVVELNSIARGLVVVDAMIKKAPVEVDFAAPVCPGKYVVVVSGEVAAVEESVEEGLRVGSEDVVDSLMIPNIHPDIAPAVTRTTAVQLLESVGIVETLSVASCIVAADAAAKAAPIKLIEIRLAMGLAGKSFLTLFGELHDVEAAVEAGAEVASRQGLLLAREIIPAPHQEMKGVLL